MLAGCFWCNLIADCVCVCVCVCARARALVFEGIKCPHY